jgi:hypothetical protein
MRRDAGAQISQRSMAADAATGTDFMLTLLFNRLSLLAVENNSLLGRSFRPHRAAEQSAGPPLSASLLDRSMSAMRHRVTATRPMPGAAATGFFERAAMMDTNVGTAGTRKAS